MYLGETLKVAIFVFCQLIMGSISPFVLLLQTWKIWENKNKHLLNFSNETTINQSRINMKLLRRIVFFLAATLVTFSLSAQDLHKSLYNMMPLSVNPAYAGDFEGSFRISGMYKGQNATWKTPSLSLDVPIIMVRKRDWLSAGLSFDADFAGDLKYGFTRSMIAASYHLSLDKKGNDYIVAGIQFGTDNYKINPNSIVSDPTVQDPTLNFNSGGAGGSGNGRQDLDNQRITNFGLMYRSKIDKNTLLNIGASYLYLIRQENKVTQTPSQTALDKRPSEFIIHGLIDRDIDKKLSIHPSFIARVKGKEGTELMVQAMAGYLIRPDLALRLKGGLGYDLNNGPALLLGADYGEWRFGMSYELALHGISAAVPSFGGFEISAQKIINIYKKPAVEPTICCPDL